MAAPRGGWVSGEEGCDLGGDQVEVVEICEVEYLEVHTLGAVLAP
jgi:hypothetical protein